MGLKGLLSHFGKGLVKRFGSEIERVAIDRIDRIDSIAHVLVDRGAERAKREVKKRVTKSK